MTDSRKITVITGIFFTLLLTVILFVEPIPQWQEYHNFADNRTLWGIDNFFNVVSNLAFLFAGTVGINSILAGKLRYGFIQNWHKSTFMVYFIGVFGIALGSAYYHYIPSNTTLVWDRLPMTIAFMGLFTAVLVDRANLTKQTTLWLLPLSILAGIASLVWWVVFDDLRFYALVQFAPLVVLLPLTCFLFRKTLYTGGLYLWAMAGWYFIAKICETLDLYIFELTGFISGHTLKHITAGIACYVLIRMLYANKKHILNE